MVTTDPDRAEREARENANDIYLQHLSTWASHCGAPRDVYVGHLNRLLKAVRLQERARLWAIVAEVRDSHGDNCRCEVCRFDFEDSNGRAAFEDRDDD